jgi:hypothetical protein
VLIGKELSTAMKTLVKILLLLTLLVLAVLEIAAILLL